MEEEVVVEETPAEVKPERVYKKLSRRNNNPKPYPICGAMNNQGYPCGKSAGHGTDHLGVGRCNNHGGSSPRGTASPAYKHGLSSSVGFPGLEEEVKRLAQDRDVFDLREHIYMMEAIAKEIIKSAQSAEDLLPVVKVITEASKAIQRLHEIEVGRRYVIDIQGVNVIVAKVREVVFRYIPDEYTRTLIARDLATVDINGNGEGDLSGNGRQRQLIEGVAMETGSTDGLED